ncbi:MAG: cob(I)yrinic acid a,c-diamide adenosyltransferase [Candidatus Omnitrophica bacterium]|nr:cob(I)yrinic acid a,c-diamide adenosyltransferase [Candidatus Omnitrophota bacterium]
MIQVYTGNGKGKTTAALGLALRACGAGMKIYICQFLKGQEYCELLALKKFKNIKIEQFGTGCFVRKSPTQKDIALAKEALRRINEILKGKEYGVVILDEINVALSLNLLKLNDVTRLLRTAPTKIELILTGRNAHPQILKLADLVSEIKEVKHYFRKGVKARKGIEY